MEQEDQLEHHLKKVVLELLRQLLDLQLLVVAVEVLTLLLLVDQEEMVVQVVVEVLDLVLLAEQAILLR